jgi:hypothetical protein
MTYLFHPEALAEYDDAAAYYAGCKPGLQIRFLDGKRESQPDNVPRCSDNPVEDNS